jgi:aminoglycoside/choline kinase family phosphotransferase
LQEIHAGELKTLFTAWSGEAALELSPLPQSGSYREYYRLRGADVTAIGVYNADLKENRAFLTFTRHFLSRGLPVPGLLGEGADGSTYLLSDLGDTTLFTYLQERRRQTTVFPGSAVDLFKRVLELLPEFQIRASADLDYRVCYPRAAFDLQSIMWDLNYFKYYFLKLARIPFDEQLLENDFKAFAAFLLEERCDFFLYRDFQSANIMVVDGAPWFIDYQGGRKGALQYDVASLLFDSKADIPWEVKELLYDHYLKALSAHYEFDPGTFTGYYRAYVLVRLMQAMGAYGFRGFYERRTQFLKNIPYALKQLRDILTYYRLPLELPHLTATLQRLTESEELKKYTLEFKAVTPLLVEISSFAYKNGLPPNRHGHGGGHVFDCRCIRNPVNYESMRDLSGRDAPVIEFFRQHGEADRFLHNIVQIVEQSVEKYLNRGFTNLQVAFGCTGGRHRSVYCAERLAAHLREKYQNHVELHLTHRELEETEAP